MVAFVSDWEARDYDPAAFAITTVWHNTSTGTILDVDVMINEQLGPYAICPAGGCPAALPRDQVVDLQNVVFNAHYLAYLERESPDAAEELLRGQLLNRAYYHLKKPIPASVLPYVRRYVDFDSPESPGA